MRVKNKLFLLTVLIGILPVIAAGCDKKAYSREKGQEADFLSCSDFLLNTIVTIQLYDKQEPALLDGCFRMIEQYELICSRTDPSSELASLNDKSLHEKNPKGNSYVLSAYLTDVIDKGLYYSRLTDGAFDLSIAPVTDLWSFQTEPPQLPDKKALKMALDLVDYRNISLKDNRITFAKPGIRIDLGAIAKGYIADRVKDYLLANGVKSAIINLGGNILCVGTKPDGTGFHIGIQKPYADRNETLAVMDIKDLSVVSSGVYERFFKLDDVLYHHILDPSTGYPCRNGLLAVTIISKKSVDGDGLSTACFALGLEKGTKLIESLPDTYAAFITEDGKLHYTKGFSDAIPINP